ncbi:MAG: hypothetical protein OCD02_09900 [Spirochaetaceae bacterium]
MFAGFSISQKEIFFSSIIVLDSNTEDDHYEEVDDTFNLLDDGIGLDETIVDEYEDFDDDLESDIPESDDSGNVDNYKYVDQSEADDYDSIDDE